MFFLDPKVGKSVIICLSFSFDWALFLKALVSLMVINGLFFLIELLLAVLFSWSIVLLWLLTDFFTFYTCWGSQCSIFFLSLSKILVEISKISSLEKYWSSIFISEGLYVRHAILNACWIKPTVFWSFVHERQFWSSCIVGVILSAGFVADPCFNAYNAVPCLSISSWMTIWLRTLLKFSISLMYVLSVSQLTVFSLACCLSDDSYFDDVD